MASIRKRQGKRRVTWRAEVCVGGRRVSATFDRKSEAAAWAEMVEERLLAGLDPDGDRPDNPEFGKALRRYLGTVTIRKAENTQAREETAAGHLRRAFSGLRLGEITPARVARYRDDRLRKVAPGTVQKELAMLSHLFTMAGREWGIDIPNPVAKVSKPRLPSGRTRFLAPAEITALLDACEKSRNSKLRPYVQLMLHTGMRPGEAAGLRWSQIDIDGRIVSLPRTKTVPRRVPLAVPAVEALLAVQPESLWRCDDFVFLPEDVSRRVLASPSVWFKRAFVNAVRRAGITDFHQHDLRHTAASYLLMSGIDLRTLAEILGHSSMDMVQRYTHLLDSHKIAAVDGLRMA